MPNSAVPGLYGKCMFTFVRTAIRFYRVPTLFTFPPEVNGRSSFSTSLSAFVVVIIFHFSHSDGSTVVLHYGHNLHFPDHYWSLAFFHIFPGNLDILFLQRPYTSMLPIYLLGCLLFSFHFTISYFDHNPSGIYFSVWCESKVKHHFVLQGYPIDRAPFYFPL